MARNIYSTHLVEQLALDGGRPAQVVARDTLDTLDTNTDWMGKTMPCLENRSDQQTEHRCRISTHRRPAMEFYNWLECDSMAGDLPLGLYLEIASAERHPNNKNNLWHLLDHLASKPVTTRLSPCC